LSSTDRVLPRPQQEKDEEEEDEEGEKEEEVKVLEEQAEFEDVMVWGHEVVVDASEDCYVRGVEEWIGFAESVSRYAATGLEWRMLISNRYILMKMH